MQSSLDAILYPALGICAVLGILGMIVAIPGTILGLRQKLIIYDGRDDLNGACVVMIVLLLALISLGFSLWLGAAASLIGLVLLAISIRRSYRANQSLGKSLLAIPTKFAMLGVMGICGLITFCAVAGLQSVARKKYQQGTEQLATGAAGLAGYVFLKMLIGKLIRPKSVPHSPP